MAFDLLATIKINDQFSGKMRNIGKETSLASRQIDSLKKSTETLTGSTNRFTQSMRSGAASATSHLASMTSHALKTSAAIGGIGVAAAGIGVAVGALKLVKDSLKGASDYEQNTIAMEHFLGLTQGAERAKAATKDYIDYLDKNANLTPFSNGDVMNAGRRLINVTSGDITQAKKLLTVSENMAALNPGKSLMDAVEALADMKTGEMERMKEFGFKISAKDIEKAGGGAKGALKLMTTDVAKMFDGGADKLSKSSLGMWSTITGTAQAGIAKMGKASLEHLKPELKRMSDYVANGGSDKMFDAGSRMMDSLTKSAIAGLHQAEDYITRHFLNNPEFNKLTEINGQVSFIFKDLKDTYDLWYANGGSKQIEDMGKSATDFLGSTIGLLTEPLLNAGIKLGTAAGQGMLDGLNRFITDHPILAGLAAGGAAPVPLPAKALIGAGVTGQGYTNQATNYIKGSGLYDWGQKALQSVNNFLPSYDTVEKIGTFGASNGNHAGGLSRVPFNGYTATLHKDERVLTKSEADATRSGRGSAGGGIVINMNGVTIRQESDIDAIAHALATEIQRAHDAGVSSYAV